MARSAWHQKKKKITRTHAHHSPIVNDRNPLCVFWEVCINAAMRTSTSSCCSSDSPAIVKVAAASSSSMPSPGCRSSSRTAPLAFSGHSQAIASRSKKGDCHARQGVLLSFGHTVLDTCTRVLEYCNCNIVAILQWYCNTRRHGCLVCGPIRFCALCRRGQ